MKNLKLIKVIVAAGVTLCVGIGVTSVVSTNNSVGQTPSEIAYNSEDNVKSNNKNTEAIAPKTTADNNLSSTDNTEVGINSAKSTDKTSNTTDSIGNIPSNEITISQNKPENNTTDKGTSTNTSPSISKPSTNTSKPSTSINNSNVTKPSLNTNTIVIPPTSNNNNNNNNNSSNTTTSDTSDKPTSSFISEIEQSIFQQVNAERAKAGLPALSYNNTMQKYARIKSQDMGDKNYFDHKDPNGNLITVKMQQDGVSYQAWGENIAYLSGYTGNSTIAKQFMTNWMNSSGHRANILSSDYTSIGIGVYKIGNKYYATQEFFK